MAPNVSSARQDGFVSEVSLEEEEERENLDFSNFRRLRAGKRISDLYDEQFLRFCKWMRADIHAHFDPDTFRAVNRHEVFSFAFNYFLLATAYLAAFTLLPSSAEILWGPLLMVGALSMFAREQVVHARMHYAFNMTDWPWLDAAVDTLLMVFTGVSKEAFYRRHVDEHLTDVSNVARVFGEAWLPFDDLPAVWWAQPWKHIMLTLNRERQRHERYNFRQLVVECVGLHLFLAAVVAELLLAKSHFFLVYHMIPCTLTLGARLMTGMFTHSGIDRRNSFNSCGLFDESEAIGLFAVTLWLINLLSWRGVSNHAVHHGYSQCPIRLVNGMPSLPD